MRRQGRPLRFALLVIGGWVSLRTVMLWPHADSLPDAIRRAVPVAAATNGRPGTQPPRTMLPDPKTASAASRDRPTVRSSGAMQVAAASQPILRVASRRDPIAPGPPRAPADQQQPPLAIPSEAVLPSHGHAANRWRASTWLFLHGDDGAVSTGQGRLGASQAGARIRYSLDAVSGLAAFARLSAPLRGPGSEAAAGLEWRPARAPIAFVAEQRFGLDDQGGGPAVAVIAGSGPDPVGLGFTLESYGETGAVFRQRTDYYAAGAVRVTRPVADIAGHDVALGAGAWGSAQRDAQRLDIGPSLTIALPLGAANARLSIDWRERIAGDPRPGSGPALTLGADF